MKSGTKLCMALIVLSLLMVGGTYAAIMSHFGQVKITVDVDQAVVLDGESYPNVIEQTATVAGGENFCRYHWLQSQTSVPVTLQFETTYNPTLEDAEIVAIYTTTITEAPKTEAEYGDLCHQLVALPVEGLTLSELLDLDLEYTVNVLVNTGVLYEWGYAPNINIWITDGTYTYVVENWGGGWGDLITGLKTQTWEELMASSGGVTLRDYLGQPWGEISIGYTAYTDTASLRADYGDYQVTSVEVRAQGGAGEGQEIRPTQFKVAGRTIDLPDFDSFTELTLPPKVILKFAICYSFDLLIRDGTYVITTTIAPPAP